MSHRLVVLPLGIKSVAKVVVYFVVVGFESKRLGVMSLGGLILFLGSEGGTRLLCAKGLSFAPWARAWAHRVSELSQVRHWFRVMAVRPRSAPRPIAMIPMAAPRRHRDDIRQSPQIPAATSMTEPSMAM